MFVASSWRVAQVSWVPSTRRRSRSCGRSRASSTPYHPRPASTAEPLVRALQLEEMMTKDAAYSAPSPETEAALTEVLHINRREMTWTQGHIYSGGHFSACRLLTTANSKTIAAGITTYDSCSIEHTVTAEEVFVALGGNVRILWGEDYSRAVEAKFRDVVWLPDGAQVKYQGERGIIFYVHPVQLRDRKAPALDANAAGVRLLKSRDMVFTQFYPEAGGHTSNCHLITEEISKILSASIYTYDGCSIEWTTPSDQASVVLDGTLRVLTGDNYSRAIEATFGDVIRVPRGTQIKYEGENAKVFTALYSSHWNRRS